MIALLLAGLATTPAPLLLERREPVMGTELQVRLVLGSSAAEGRGREALEAAVADARATEAQLSEWRPDAPLGRLNTEPTRAVVLPPEAYALLQRSLDWSRASAGAFDPSFASLWGLWRFDPGDGARIPRPDEARARAQLIDYRRIHLDPRARSVRLEPGMKIGLGGIAKGYEVDRIVALLRARGFANFFVKLGGDLYLGGRHGARPWVAGIQDPRDRTRSFALLALEDSAFTTGGDYEHFLIKDGVRYHHIIDPQTGYPARACRSVTIVAPDAETGDALDTAVFVLGPRRGLELIRGRPGVEAVIVTGDGELVVSEGLKGKLQVKGLSPHEGP